MGFHEGNQAMSFPRILWNHNSSPWGVQIDDSDPQSLKYFSIYVSFSFLENSTNELIKDH